MATCADAPEYPEFPSLHPKDNLRLRLLSIERMLSLPVVSAAWQQSIDVYGRVKGNNRLFNWALNNAEVCALRAVDATTPIVSKFETSINYVDKKLANGIEHLENTAPIIKDTPKEIYNQTKTKIIENFGRFRSGSSYKNNVREKAVQAKEIPTEDGIVERYVKTNFVDTENEDESFHLLGDEELLLHKVQTFDNVSNKISRRIYDYLHSALRLTQKVDFTSSCMDLMMNSESTA